MNPEVKIVPMEAGMAETAWEWAKREGWNPGIEDHVLLPSIDPDGCLAMFIDDGEGPRMIGAITAVDYGGYGFVGMYLVDPAYRGKGYGKQLIPAITTHLTGLPNVGVDAVLPMVPTYERAGLKTAYETVRYRLAEGTALAVVSSKAAEEEDLGEIIAYDARVFGVDRGGFLRRWVTAPRADAALLRRNGRIVGYGVVRDCHRGRKVGPLFADDENAARDLLGWLLARRPGEQHYLDLPSFPGHGTSLVRGATADLVCIRMYAGSYPRQDVARVFGNTTFEMG